jgi:hypothetical protein
MISIKGRITLDVILQLAKNLMFFNFLKNRSFGLKSSEWQKKKRKGAKSPPLMD